MACLRLAARTESKSTSVNRALQPLEDRRDLLLELFVEHQFAPAELRHDLDRHVVGRRPEAAAGDDQVDALAGKEPQLRRDVARAGRRRS